MKVDVEYYERTPEILSSFKPGDTCIIKDRAGICMVISPPDTWREPSCVFVISLDVSPGVVFRFSTGQQAWPIEQIKPAVFRFEKVPE